MKLFISYSTEDIGIARRLYADMQAAGAEVFQFGESERLGRTSWPQVLDAISASDVFVVLISQSALKSKPVNAEIDHAHYDAVNNDKPEVIPAIIQSGATPPNLIRRFTTLDLTSYEPGVARLIGQLGLKAFALPKARPPAMPLLPDRGALLAEHEKANPEPDPVALWSRSAEKVVANYELLKPPELSAPARSLHLNSLLAGKSSKYDDLWFNKLKLPKNVPGTANKSAVLTSKLLSLNAGWKFLPAPVLKTAGAELQWDTVLGALTYAVEESLTDDFGSAKEVYRGPATVYKPGFRLSQHFRVKAVGAPLLSDSEWSNTVVFGFATRRLIAPILQWNIRVLSWNTVPGATGYVLESSAKPTFAIPKIIYKGSDTQYLAFDTETAYYRVRAEGVLFSDSPWSNVVRNRSG